MAQQEGRQFPLLPVRSARLRVHQAVARAESVFQQFQDPVAREVLVDVLGDARGPLAAEAARAAVAAQIQVEDVVPLRREIVREASGREVPRIPVLAESVDQEHRRERPVDRTDVCHGWRGRVRRVVEHLV